MYESDLARVGHTTAEHKERDSEVRELFRPMKAKGKQTRSAHTLMGTTRETVPWSTNREGKRGWSTCRKRKTDGITLVL